MPSLKLPIEPEGPKRLEITWEGLYNHMTVSFDDEHLADVPKDEAERGTSVRLPDGSTLSIELRGVGAFGTRKELHLARDGKPLPGTAGDPETAAKTAGYLLYFLAGMNALCGAVSLSGSIEMLGPDMAIGTLVMAGLFGVLGLFTMRGSRIALGIAMAVYLLDGVATLVLTSSAGGSPPLGMLWIRVMFLMAMGRSFMTMGRQD